MADVVCGNGAAARDIGDEPFMCCQAGIRRRLDLRLVEESRRNYPLRQKVGRMNSSRSI